MKTLHLHEKTLILRHNLESTMKRLLTVLIIALSVAFPDHCAATSKLSAAMDSLDIALDLGKNRLKSRMSKIDSLKEEMRHSRPTSAAIYGQIAKEYSGVNTDSAITYFDLAWRKAEADGEIGLRNTLLVDYASQLPKVALFGEALATVDSICPDSLNARDKINYYGVRAQIYIDAANYHTLPCSKKKNLSKAIAYLDTLSSLLPDKSLAKRAAQAQSLIMQGRETMALGELNEVFDNLSPQNPAYAIIANMLAKAYSQKKDKKDEYLYFLTVSATADALNANGETASLMLLGSELFKQGDIDRSFRYLAAAAESMRESGSKMLISEMAPPLSVFSETMSAREKSRTTWFAILAAIMVAVVVISCIFTWRTRKLSASNAAANEKLTAYVSTRDQYINQLLELCSVYVEGLEDFNRLVGRKLKANQIQDLYKLIESGKMMQDQTERFFEVFDTAVFNIFPNFLQDVNALFQPDKQITLPESGKLTPELRIVAFIRLGVNDSNRLSKFLGLSLNTVYTYRNRLKGRAISRENFETDILNIGK